MIMKQKVRAQVKSRFYYVFWGIATVAVVAGQWYVGTGYRLLHGDMQELLNKVDEFFFIKMILHMEICYEPSQS